MTCPKRFARTAAGIAVSALLASFLVSCGEEGEAPSPDAAVAGDTSEPGSAARVPDGFHAVSGTGPEPFTATGWAAAVIHDKTGIEMVFVPAGEFRMGAPKGEPGSSEDERPVHDVKITRPFYIGKFEVTQDQWSKITRGRPFEFKGGDNPADSVSWNDCRDFLSAAGDGLRFPTEAEWEYACRAGTGTAYSFGEGDRMLGDYAWHKSNSGAKAHAVGQKKPNPWGLCDMHGNLWEWCEDWFDTRYYETSPVEDPRADIPPRYPSRVMRGGAWNFGDRECRSAERTGFGEEAVSSANGLRVARNLE